MSNFEFNLYLSQFSSHRFSSNITGFLFSIRIQRYPLLFSTIIGSKVMKANVRRAGNVTCQLRCKNYNKKFLKSREISTFVKPCSLTKNDVESFLLKIITKFQNWLVSMNSKNT